MCENWSYKKLADYIKKQSIDEMKRAEVLIERVLLLDGTPTMEPLKLTVGATVRHMIESDLALELSAVTGFSAHGRSICLFFSRPGSQHRGPSLCQTCT
jgi:bacterioferritin